jgi:hypothetical protein
MANIYGTRRNARVRSVGGFQTGQPQCHGKRDLAVTEDQVEPVIMIMKLQEGLKQPSILSIVFHFMAL